MTIKKASLLVNTFTILALVCAGALLFYLRVKTDVNEKATEERFYSILLVDELRKSSEELTRQVRNYAVTGNASAENDYNKVLAVRGGEEPRPASAQVSPGKKRVLLDLLKEYGVTKEEFALVEQANALSDNLVALEVEAMNAVKGIFMDERKQYTVHKEPNKELAMKLVFGNAYDSEVSKIMKPMSEFEEKVLARTERSMEQAYNEQKTAENFCYVSLAAVLVFALFNLMFNSVFIVRPLHTVIGVLKTVVTNGKTHLNRRINISGKNEISELAGFFNKTFENIGELIKDTKTTVDHLASVSEKLSSVSTQLASGAEETVNQSNTVASTTEQMAVNINAMASGAEQASVNANEVAGAAEQMNMNMNTIASAVEEMSASINQIASNADEAHKVAIQATGKASKRYGCYGQIRYGG